MELRWEHPEKKRYYVARLQKDLLGDWVVTKIWGGLGSAGGRVVHILCESEKDGVFLIEKISKVRSRRGYVLIQENYKL